MPAEGKAVRLHSEARAELAESVAFIWVVAIAQGGRKPGYRL